MRSIAGVCVVVAELGDEPLDDPVGIAQPAPVATARPSAVVDTLRSTAFTNPRTRLGAEGDRLADGGVGRHAGERELVGAEPQQACASPGPAAPCTKRSTSASQARRMRVVP